MAKDIKRIIEINGKKVKTYQCGPDIETDFYQLGIDFSQVDYIAYWYQIEPWAGSGIGIIRNKDGKYYSWNMGHCSCYGACERAEIEEFSYNALLEDAKGYNGGLLYERMKKMHNRKKK